MCVIRSSKSMSSKAVVWLPDGRKVESEAFLDDLTYKDAEDGYSVRSKQVIEGLLKAEGYDYGDAEKTLIIRDVSEDDAVYVSDHAEKRIREREGINRKAVSRIVKKAWEEGTDGTKVPGLTGQWVRSKDQHNRKYIIYGNFLYIFDNARKVLITVIPVPSRTNMLRLADNKDNKRHKVRDMDRHKRDARYERKAAYDL